MAIDRNRRIDVFNETVTCSLNREYENNLGEVIKIPRMNDGLSLDSSQLYEKDLYPIINKEVIDKISVNTEIKVVDQDCLYAAKELVDEGYATAVLNMASFKRPGGGVGKGSAAQEENLCRRTNLFESIFRFHSEMAKDYGLPVEKKQYPLKMNFGAVYSPSISVFRGGEDVDYKFLDEPFFVDVISVAAIKRPNLVNNHLEDNSKEILRDKVRTILNLALEWSNEAIVLGALGCGAYGTPPDDMAEIFKEVLNEERYQNKFHKIVFAIIDDHNAYKEHNPRGNFLPFKEILEGK